CGARGRRHRGHGQDHRPVPHQGEERLRTEPETGCRVRLPGAGDPRGTRDAARGRPKDRQCGAQHRLPAAHDRGRHASVPGWQPHRARAGQDAARGRGSPAEDRAGKIFAPCASLADPARPLCVQGPGARVLSLPDCGVVPLHAQDPGAGGGTDEGPFAPHSGALSNCLGGCDPVLADIPRGAGETRVADDRFDVLTIGNAIVDVIAPMETGFLAREGLTEGIMHLVDAERSAYLYSRMPTDKRQISGGSSANTAAGVASLGGRAAFVGKVAADDLGDIFAEDLSRIGVHYGVSRLVGGPATARSMILVSAGGERTMNTYLGACQQLTEADIVEAEIASATVTYMEGYLWDPLEAKKAFVRA